MTEQKVKSGGPESAMRWFLAVFLSGVMLLPWTCRAATDELLSVRVAVAPSRPPFSFRTETGVLAGFDVSIAQAICAELQRPCMITSLPPAQALDELAARHLDMVIAGLTDTPETAPKAVFSDPYYRTRSVFIARRQHGRNNSVSFKRVGAQTGSAQYSYLKAIVPASTSILTSSTLAALWEMLYSGVTDVVLVDSLLGYSFLLSPQGASFDTVGLPLSFDQLPGAFRIALPKGQEALLQDVNRALRAIRRNGTYTTLSSRYFSIDIN